MVSRCLPDGLVWSTSLSFARPLCYLLFVEFSCRAESIALDGGKTGSSVAFSALGQVCLVMTGFVWTQSWMCLRRQDVLIGKGDGRAVYRSCLRSVVRSVWYLHYGECHHWVKGVDRLPMARPETVNHSRIRRDCEAFWVMFPVAGSPHGRGWSMS
jgi:hypothetical protein